MAVRKSRIKNTVDENGNKIKTYMYVGDLNKNIIKAGAGDDRLYGNGGDDALYGGKGSDDLFGGSGRDHLYGGAGDDHLNGGTGRDFLYGGAGQDNFVFDTALDGLNYDFIADLNTKIGEKIMLDHEICVGNRTLPKPPEVGDDGSYSGRGLMSPASFRVGKAAQDADDRIIYHKETGALFFDADGNGAGQAVQFAEVKAGMNLKASDFFML